MTKRSLSRIAATVREAGASSIIAIATVGVIGVKRP